MVLKGIKGINFKIKKKKLKKKLLNFKKKYFKKKKYFTPLPP
jgi:hypothetical protein